jgi:hypothetical protein
VRLTGTDTGTEEERHNLVTEDFILRKLFLCLKESQLSFSAMASVKKVNLSLRISTLDAGEWSTSRSGRFVHRDIDPSTYWAGGWVGFRGSG